MIVEVDRRLQPVVRLLPPLLGGGRIVPAVAVEDAVGRLEQGAPQLVVHVAEPRAGEEAERRQLAVAPPEVVEVGRGLGREVVLHRRRLAAHPDLRGDEQRAGEQEGEPGAAQREAPAAGRRRRRRRLLGRRRDGGRRDRRDAAGSRRAGSGPVRRVASSAPFERARGAVRRVSEIPESSSDREVRRVAFRSSPAPPGTAGRGASLGSGLPSSQASRSAFMPAAVA